MSLRQRLDDDLKTAMKQGEKLRLSVLRMLKADIQNATIAKGDDLDEQEVMDLLSRYSRKRKDAAAEYEKGGRQDLVDKELAEHEIVNGYLPAALGEEELAALVDEIVTETGAEGMKQMGAVMKLAIERSAGRADGSLLSGLVKARLTR